MEKLAASGAQLRFCYEAGPCGYGLHRHLVEMGPDCIVVAPSLVPVKAERQGEDRRDALMLAKLHRAGELTTVWVPDGAHEAMRDLMRARAVAMRVTGQIADLLPQWSLAAVQAMRGVGFIVAVTVVAEVGDFQRFVNPRQLMAYLGLTPSEHSSDASVRRDGITNTSPIIQRYPLISGIDLAGIVEASDNAEFAVGDAVVLNGRGLSQTHDGGFAQKARQPPDWLSKLSAGITTVNAPKAKRVEAWARLAYDFDLGKLDDMVTAVGLEEAPDVARSIFSGKIRGRTVVDVKR